MTAAFQTLANQTDGTQGPGPKTAEGRAISAQNSLRHGILTTEPVLRGLESEEIWRAHRDGMVTSLAPAGELETHLAERVALTLWRLGRVARYEHEAIALGQERARIDAARAVARAGSRSLAADLLEEQSPPDLPRDYRMARERRRLFGRFANMEEGAPLTAAQADEIMGGAEYHSGLDLVDLDESPFLSEDQVWTAGAMKRFLASLVETAIENETADDFSDLDGLLSNMHEYARYKENELKGKVKELAAATDRCRRERLLPDEATLAKVARYEAHLHRMYTRDLHELQRLQAARMTGATPIPAALDVTIEAGEGEKVAKTA